MTTADPELFEEPAGPVLVPASARELKATIKHWRHGRATRNLVEAFHDAYIAVIAALMIGAMVVNVVINAQRVVAQCSTTACLSARTLLPWASLALAVAAALAVSRLFGPILASAAEGFWLLDTPVSRASLLRVRLVAAVALAAVGGAVVGGLIAALTGSSWLEIGIWAAGTGLAASAAVAFAAAEQGAERRLIVRLLSYILCVVGIAAMLAVIGVAARWITLDIRAGLQAQIGWAIIVASTVILLLSLVFATARLGRIRRARLLSGGDLVSGISGAFFALDIGLARDILVERRAIELGHVKPARGKGIGAAALTWREWQRLRRFPTPLLVVAGTLVVPYASDALGMSAITPVFGALALFGATIPLLGGLRVLTRSGGLARSLPFTTAQIKIASITVPAVIAALWAVAATAAFTGFGDGAANRSVYDAALMAIATAAAGLLGAIRWTQAKAVDFGAPMIATQAGAFPPGLMTNVFRGFDICLLITAPMLLGLSPFWSLVLAAIVALFLLNNFDPESMRARQAEQQKLLEEQKKKREAAKGR